MANYDILKEYEAHKAPVPSYDHFVELTEKVKENQQLKELLYSLKCCLTSENIEPQIRIDKSLGKIINAIGEKK